MCARWSSDAVSGATCSLLRTLDPLEDLRLDECPAPPSFSHLPALPDVPPFMVGNATRHLYSCDISASGLSHIPGFPKPRTLSPSHHAPPASTFQGQTLTRGRHVPVGGYPGPRDALLSWGQVSEELLHRVPLSCLPKSLFGSFRSGLSPPTPSQFGSGSQCSRHDLSPLGSPRAGCVPGLKVTSSLRAALCESLSFQVRIVVTSPIPLA